MLHLHMLHWNIGIECELNITQGGSGGYNITYGMKVSRSYNRERYIAGYIYPGLTCIGISLSHQPRKFTMRITLLGI